MVPRRLDGSGVEAGVERNGTRTEGGVYHTTRPLFAVVVRVFRPRASVPIRASGDGKDGSDPPLFAAGADRLMGGCGTRCTAGCTTPPPAFVGVAPVLMSPCGKAPPPARGRDDEPQRPARCVTDFSAFSRHRRRKRRVRLDVAGPVPRRSRGGSRPLQHPRTFTAPSSRGTTLSPAWRCSLPGNFSSAHPVSGSPGWASVWGSGPAFPRGRFRLRRTARRSSAARYITRSHSPRARPRNG